MRTFGIARSRIAGFLGLVGIAVLAFASASLADGSVSVSLTGVGNGANGPGQGTTLGNVYVDPYFGTVGGLGSNVPIICDDWSNNTYMNESWTATVTSATNVAGGSPMFGSSNQNLYNEAVWLATQIMASYNNGNYTAQIEYSFALWMLTYGQNGTYAESPSPTVYLSEYGTPTEISQATIFYEEAAGLDGYAGEAGFNAAGWEILTPVAGSSNPSQDGTPQEFLVYTPEPSTILLLGLGIAGLFLLKWRRRGNAGAGPMVAA